MRRDCGEWRRKWDLISSKVVCSVIFGANCGVRTWSSNSIDWRNSSMWRRWFMYCCNCLIAMISHCWSRACVSCIMRNSSQSSSSACVCVIDKFVNASILSTDNSTKLANHYGALVTNAPNEKLPPQVVWLCSLIGRRSVSDAVPNNWLKALPNR